MKTNNLGLMAIAFGLLMIGLSISRLAIMVGRAAAIGKGLTPAQYIQFHDDTDKLN